MSAYHEITLYLKPKQIKSLEKRKTFQLTHADLTSKSGEPVTLKISKKLHTKFNNAMRNNKGIRIMAEFHEGGGIFDIIKNIGRKVISVIPKPIAKAGLSGLAAATGNPALIPLANMATDAVYATQGKGYGEQGQGERIIKINDGNRLNPKYHQGGNLLRLLFGGSIKPDSKEGKGILDFLFGKGLNPHHGGGLFDLLFGGSYKEGKGIFDKIKKIGKIATKIIPKEVIQGIANQTIDKIVPSQLQGIAKAGTELGVNQGYKALGSGLKKLNLKRGSNDNDSNIQFLHTKGNLLNGVQLQNGIKKIRKGGSFLTL